MSPPERSSGEQPWWTPAPGRLLGEALWVLELPRLLLRLPDLARQPRGRG